MSESENTERPVRRKVVVKEDETIKLLKEILAELKNINLRQ